MDETIQFLDHKVKIKSITETSVVVDVYYTGNDLRLEVIMPSFTIPVEELPAGLIAGRHTVTLGTSLNATFYQPWYLEIDSIDVENQKVYVIAGRHIETGETFFVDGAEYDVAMIYGPTPLVPGTNNDFEYITIRNPLPMDSVILEWLTILKEPVKENETLPLLPPFNMEHDVIDDINISHTGEYGIGDKWEIDEVNISGAYNTNICLII